MPPKEKITKENIIEASISLIRNNGLSALNARAIASELNCSVQPIFRVFNSMGDLKSAVYQRANEIYIAVMKAAFESKDGFDAMGLAYVNFAKTESNLFSLLFMTNAFNQGSAAHITGSTTGDDEVIRVLSQMTGLDVLKAQELYTCIWFTTHGIASLLATNSCTLNDNEIKRMLNICFEGLIYSLNEKAEMND